MNPGNFFAELQRRNVYKVAVAYAIIAWLLIQIATQVFPVFEIPLWAVRLVVVGLAFGFPIALFLSWAFEITPEGMKRTEQVAPHESITRSTGRKLDFLIIGVLLGVIGLLIIDRVRRPPRLDRAVPQKSIAVLPFENLSAERENDFFASGVQDQIMTNLAKIADLTVISRTSVMQYKNTTNRNLREIAQQLGVANVVEGSVQRVANRIRVSAQLIDARSDAHLWAEGYDRDLADVFAIQTEIANAIADQLSAHISPREKAAMAQPPTTDLQANKLYVQAKELEASAFDPNAKQNLLQAVRFLDEAVRRDPQFLLAYCLLGRVHLDLYWQGLDHTSARRELANAAIQNAAHLQADAGEVHLMWARYAYHGFRDYDRARAELDLARSTLPNNADIYFMTAAIDRRQARWKEATRNFARAIELDPRNFLFLKTAALTSEALRRYPEAKRLFERALVLAPHNYAIRLQLALNDFSERADRQPWRTQLAAILKEAPSAAQEISSDLFWCALSERDPAAAARALAVIPPEGLQDNGTNSIAPREWYAGLAARTFGDEATARTAFTAARAIQEKIVRDQPDYAPAWSLLGLIDAGLGRKEDALREGRRACELLPLSQDSWDGAAFVTTLAIIYAWSGEKDLALAQLAASVQNPDGANYGDLKLNPQWDPLRDDPRFEEIVATLAPKAPSP